MILAFAMLAGQQETREQAITRTQADIENYKYNEDVEVKYKGEVWTIDRAVSAGRCRTKFLMIEKREVIVDWSSIVAFTPEKYALKIRTKGLPAEVVFDFYMVGEPGNFIEVFEYLRSACAGKSAGA